MSKVHPPQKILHVPVLLDSIIDLLKPSKSESYLDLTAGYGGHASRFLEITGNYADSVLVDRDDFAIQHLKSFSDLGARLIHSDFVAACQQLINEERTFDMVLIDLGVSSPQLDSSERGFSFTNSGLLDMRMDRGQEMSAEKLINTATEQELTHIINQYGEEPIGFSKTIAHSIVANRPLFNTKELADLVTSSYRGRWKKTHPATRTFQAIRIAVNDELKQVEDLMPNLPRLLKPGGRVGIISFHSLEDRIVKRYFKDQFDAGFEAILQPLTKKPIAGNIYDVHNPRARSAKLRAAVKK